VAAFSLEQDWSDPDYVNSHYYVMTLWSRLVTAIPYLDSTRSKATTTGLLEEYAPQVGAQLRVRARELARLLCAHACRCWRRLSSHD
jgi:hypothetical protein